LHAECRPGRNHACQFLWRSVKGFWCGEGSNFGLFHWLASSHLKHARTTVRVCDGMDSISYTCYIVCRCISHTRTVVRECFKGAEASQWKRPKFDPSPHQNHLTDLHKNWQAWLSPGRHSTCEILYRSVHGVSVPQIRDFAMLLGWLVFSSFFGGSSIRLQPTPLNGFLTQSTSEHVVPGKEVPLIFDI